MNGADDVRGEVFGPMSFPYCGVFATVETWPKHGMREVKSVREHRWFSEKNTNREALAEYIAAQSRESVLGDGSPCIITLELSTQHASS